MYLFLKLLKTNNNVFTKLLLLLLLIKFSTAKKTIIILIYTIAIKFNLLKNYKQKNESNS